MDFTAWYVDLRAEIEPLFIAALIKRLLWNKRENLKHSNKWRIAG
jgi:hypothetical protein